MPVRAIEVRQISAGEVRNVAVDMRGKLDTGETLTGTPTATEETGGITTSAAQVNMEAVVVNGRLVPAGQAIQFTADPNEDASGSYEVVVSCATSAGQVIDGALRLRIV